MSLSSIILSEVNVGRPVLYHFTSWETALIIIKTDKLEVSKFYDGSVSFTRDHMGLISEKMDLSFRFALDWNRLRDFYKTKPHIDGGIIHAIMPRDINKWDWQSRNVLNSTKKYFDPEAEERIDTDVDKLHRFVIKMEMNIKKLQKNKEETTEDVRHVYTTIKRDAKPEWKDIPFEVVDKWRPVKL